jgi:hypothetical protein
MNRRASSTSGRRALSGPRRLAAPGNRRDRRGERGSRRWGLDDTVRSPGLSARTSGVYLRADPSDLQVLEGGDEEERAQLIAQRLRGWKSAATSILSGRR